MTRLDTTKKAGKTSSKCEDVPLDLTSDRESISETTEDAVQERTLLGVFSKELTHRLIDLWPVAVVAFLGLLILLYGMTVIIGHEASYREASWAVVDTEKIIHDWAEAQAKSSRSQAEIESEIELFLKRLDQVMTTLSQEKQMVFLHPSAVVSLHGLDMTGEIQKRIAADKVAVEDTGVSR